MKYKYALLIFISILLTYKASAGPFDELNMDLPKNDLPNVEIPNTVSPNADVPKFEEAKAPTQDEELPLIGPEEFKKLDAADIQPAIIEQLKQEDLQKNSQENTANNSNEVNNVNNNIEVSNTQPNQLPELENIELPALDKNVTDSKPVKIEVSSQRIPAGTILPVKIENAISSVYSNMGDQFNATLTSDVVINDQIVLPSGSVLRGTVGQLKKSSLLRKEAKVMLIFDHIVTPSGKQLPIYAYMTNTQNVNYEGNLVGGTSYKTEFQKDAATSKDIVLNSTNFGVEKGKEYLGGFPVIITAPVCAIGGALGGTGYIVGKSVYNVFVKGGDVNINQGTLINIALSKPLDVPVD